MPPLTEERRKELTKVAGTFAENAKIAVRNVRRDGMETVKQLEKDKEISEDELKRRENNIQVATDEHIEKIDQTLEQKTEEIMQV